MVVPLVVAAAGRTAAVAGAGDRELKTVRSLGRYLPQGKPEVPSAANDVGSKRFSIDRFLPKGKPAVPSAANDTEPAPSGPKNVRSVSRFLPKSKQASLPAAANDNEPRIHIVTAAFMVSGAFLMELVQLLLILLVAGLILGPLLTFLAIISYAIWFKIHDVSVISGRKAGLKAMFAFGGSLLEMTPLVDGFFFMTTSVIGIIVISRIEDKLDSKKSSPAHSGRVVTPRAGNDNQKNVPAANDSAANQLREAA